MDEGHSLSETNSQNQKPSNTKNDKKDDLNNNNDSHDVNEYPLKRANTSMWKDCEETTSRYMNLLMAKIESLERDTKALKQKLELLEEDSKTKWGPKYTRRLALVVNIMHGLWIFTSRFIRRIQKKKTKILQMMVPNATGESINIILYEAYMFSIAKSWVFFVAALCMTSSASWKRNFGVGLSTISSLYFLFQSNFLPGVNMVNIAATLLYIFAQWASAENNQPNVKTLQAYIAPYRSKESAQESPRISDSI